MKKLTLLACLALGISATSLNSFAQQSQNLTVLVSATAKKEFLNNKNKYQTANATTKATLKDITLKSMGKIAAEVKANQGSTPDGEARVINLYKLMDSFKNATNTNQLTVASDVLTQFSNTLK